MEVLSGLCKQFKHQSRHEPCADVISGLLSCASGEVRVIADCSGTEIDAEPTSRTRR